MNDTYLGNINVKRDGVTTNWTNDDVAEYAKCMYNPSYFASTYCKIISLDEGLVSFELYPYQEKMFESFTANRFNIVLACRQSGKSISSVAYLLWYAIFHPEKVIAVLANKGATSREMLSRITLMLENLPFFLQPGCRALNKGSIEFSNNSRIIAAATSGSSIRGMSVSLLYLDEFAFVENAAEFYTSTYPVISSGKTTKVIITSTANGIGNIFHKIWEGAVQGTNEYKPFRVDWGDVPGRDEKWKEQTIANTSHLQFDQEFGNTFFGTGDTLIDGQTLLELRAKQPLQTVESGRGKILALPRAGINALKFRKMTGAKLTDMLREGMAMKKSMDLSYSQMVMAANTPMLLKTSLVDGRTESGVMASGQVVGIIEDLPSCADLIDRIITEANAVLADLTRS